MADYEIGYGKPPKRTQFKKGVCPNPKGRGKRAKLSMSEVIDELLSAPVEYQERGRLKRRPRILVFFRQLASLALKGETDAANFLMKARAEAVKRGGKTAETIYIRNPLPVVPRPPPPLSAPKS
jgi:hypothetical protein